MSAWPDAPPVTTLTFNYTGSAQVFGVPAGVTSIDVECFGGQGAQYDSIGGVEGGKGARIKGRVPVTPGELLYVRVGGAGGYYAANQSPQGRLGGYNGGGNGGSGSGSEAGGGGGATDIRRPPASNFLSPQAQSYELDQVEYGLGGWYTVSDNPNDFSIVTDTAHSGAKSLRVFPLNGGSLRVIRTFAKNVVVGESVTMGFWFKNMMPLGNELTVFNGAQYGPFNTQINGPSTVVTDNNWHFTQHTFIAPETGRLEIVPTIYRSNGTAVLDIRIDDVFVSNSPLDDPLGRLVVAGGGGGGGGGSAPSTAQRQGGFGGLTTGGSNNFTQFGGQGGKGATRTAPGTVTAAAGSHPVSTYSGALGQGGQGYNVGVGHGGGGGGGGLYGGSGSAGEYLGGGGGSSGVAGGATELDGADNVQSGNGLLTITYATVDTGWRVGHLVWRDTIVATDASTAFGYVHVDTGIDARPAGSDLAAANVYVDTGIAAEPAGSNIAAGSVYVNTVPPTVLGGPLHLSADSSLSTNGNTAPPPPPAADGGYAEGYAGGY